MLPCIPPLSRVLDPGRNVLLWRLGLFPAARLVAGPIQPVRLLLVWLMPVLLLLLLLLKHLYHAVQLVQLGRACMSPSLRPGGDFAAVQQGLEVVERLSHVALLQHRDGDALDSPAGISAVAHRSR